jgi:two-component system, NarL family, invasion response regulator UvrY
LTIIRVGIVDDHPIVRAGLQQFLGEQVDLRIVGDAADGRAALDLVRTGELDVLLMDVSMPGTSGVEALQAIKARAPALPVVILSGLPAAHYAVNLLRMGASAYLNKEGDPEQILQAIHTVVRGRRFITPEVAELLADGLSLDADKAPHETLSEREWQVFLRLAQGEALGAVADGMALSVKTVSTYRTRVLAKLQLTSNSDLTYYALKNGLIQ